MSERTLPFRTTPDGWNVLTIRYSSVPGYDFDAATQGMGEEEIRREILLDWNATSGVRVYPQFNPDLHVAREPIPYDPRETLYCGWDFGGTPAFAVTQMNSHGQWLVLSAVAPEQGSGLGTYEFGQMCADHLHQEYALPYGRDLKDLRTVHFGDPAGNQKAVQSSAHGLERDAKSHFSIIRDGVHIPIGVDDRGETLWERKPGWGWNIIAGEMHIPKRLEAMRARLSLIVNGHVAFLVSPSCQEAVTALASYHYKVRADGRQELDPFKGWESHLSNALEYVCTRLWHQPDADDDEDMPRREPFRSHASARPEELGYR